MTVNVATFLVALFFALLMPDQASAGIIAGIIASINAFAATSALAAFVVRMGYALAFSVLSRLANKPDKPRKPGIKTETTTSGGTNPQTFPLGKIATAGNMAAVPYSHPNSGAVPNRWLTYVVDVSDLPGVQLSRVMVAGEYVEDFEPDDDGHDQRGMFEDDDAHLLLTWFDGLQTEASPYMLEHYGDHADRPWSADMIGTGVAYAVVTFNYNRKVFNQLPGVRFEVLGIPLYDPRKDSTAGGAGAHRWDDWSTWETTENPAVMIYNILRGITLPDEKRWGGSVSAEDLPLDSWFAAMNECDVDVPLADGGSEKQYTAGYEVSLDQAPAAVIDELLKACSGEIVEMGGVYKLHVGPPALPTFFITDDDILADMPEYLAPHPGLEGVFNAIHVTHPEPASLWEAVDAPPLYNAEWEAADGGRQLVAQVDLPAVFSGTQAQRLGAAWIADARRFRRHGMTLPPSAAVLEPLDTIGWVSAKEQYGNEVFEISELTDDLVECLQTVAIRQREAGDFAWDPAIDEIQVDRPCTLKTPPAPRVLQGFALERFDIQDDAGTARRPGLRIVWNGAQVAAAEAVEYRVQLAAGTAVIAGLVSDPSEGEVLVSAGILPATVYRASARVIARQGGAWTAWASVVTDDLRLGGGDLDDDVRGQLAAADAVRADHDSLVAGFDGTLADLEVDYQAAQQAAQGSEAAHQAAATALAAAEAARNLAQNSATDAGNSATTAAGSASSAATSATDAGASATAASGGALLASTSAAEAARAAAVSGPAILAAPAEQWTKASWATYSALLKPAADLADFVTGDPDFGAAYEFQGNGNHTVGPAYPIAWHDDAVHELRVRFKVVDDGTMGALDMRLGASVQLGETLLGANIQTGTISATAADGIVEAVAWFTKRSVGAMPALPAGVLFLGTSAAIAGGDKLYPHLRQNAGNSSDGLVRLGTFEVRDITAQVDAMLAEDAALGSASAASTSASAAAASETAAGTSASAAETARQAAQTARGGAESARDAAATSETNAAGSASAAATSATNAANSAGTAGNSASAASTSASAASTSATDAGQHATAASGHANTASIQAGNATTSATASATSATSASDSAAAAATSATLAAGVLSEINLSATDYQRVIDGVASLEGVGSLETASDGAGVFGQGGTVISATGAGSFLTSGSTNGLQVEIPVAQAGSFGGRRVRVDILARPASASPAAGFTAAYSTADNGNSGRNDFTLGSGWAWYSFYYDVPVPNLGGTDWVGLWGDIAQTGKQTEFARVVIRAASEAADIPELGVVQADVSVVHAAVADLEGNAAASYVARVSAGGASAGFEMVAADDPVNGPTSSILFSADNLLIPGSTRSRHVSIDENLDIDSVSGAFRMGKLSSADFTSDGIFMGRTEEAGGQIGFGFLAGRVSGGVEEYIQLTKADGLTIKNATFLIGAGTSTHRTITSSQTISLGSGVEKVSLEIQAGGAGGHSGTSQAGPTSIAGASGGNTVVVLKDGATTVQTWTASGGAAGGGNNPVGLAGGAGGAAPASPRGDGGDGGSGQNSEEWRNGVGGVGGGAGQLLSISNYDVSGLADPKLTITIGGGGSGAAGAQSGAGGQVRAIEVAAGEFPAGPISKTTAAKGQLTVTANTSGSFPDFGAPGVWMVYNAPASFKIAAGGGTNIVLPDGGGTFISGLDVPTYFSDHTQTKTLNYRFWPMSA